MDDEIPRRRDPDDTVIPIIMLKVEERLREDRHTFRNEVASIAAKQEVAQAQASKEHAEVRADIAELRHVVDPLPELIQRVGGLEEVDRADHAVTKALRDFSDRSRRQAYALGGLIVAAAGVLIGLLR